MEHSLGVLRYEKQEELSQEAIFAIIACAIFVVIMLIVVCIFCLIKFRRNDDMMKKMRKEMDQLESRVANECKDGEFSVVSITVLLYVLFLFRKFMNMSTLVYSLKKEFIFIPALCSS